MLFVINDDGSAQPVPVIHNHDAVKVYANDKARTLTIVVSTEEYKNQLVDQVLFLSKPSEYFDSGDGEIRFRFSEEEWKKWAAI